MEIVMGHLGGFNYISWAWSRVAICLYTSKHTSKLSTTISQINAYLTANFVVEPNLLGYSNFPHTTNYE